MNWNQQTLPGIECLKPARESDFLLGISQLAWMRRSDFEGVKLFVSMATLAKYVNLPSAGGCILAFDSGAFQQLQLHGKWLLDADSFADKCLTVKRHFGSKALWFSPQDWMCEPVVVKGGRTKDGVFVGTGLSIEEHQLRTVENFLQLRRKMGDLVIPVVQGWSVFDYWRCLEMYMDVGIDLSQFELVGVGSVCRRQSTREAVLIMQSISSEIGTRLHGYGFKKEGFKSCGQYMTSGDSFAWSYAGRMRPNFTHEHYKRSAKFVSENKGKRGCADDCSGCPEYALFWRNQLIESIRNGRPEAEKGASQ